MLARMKICILGAGVIGLTTAWELAERGHEVVILDRQRRPGAETSFANAAQLAYTYVSPLASPDLLRKLPSLLLDPAAPMRIRPSLDPAFLRWGFVFLAACTTRKERATTAAMLSLAASSRDVLTGLAAAQNLEFGLRTAGKLVLYRKAEPFESARRQAAPGQQVLAGVDCLALEPSLKLTPRDIAGGIFSPGDQLGDCHAFCGELAERLRRRNAVTWQMGTQVRRPILSDGRLRAVATDAGEIAADLFVLSFGPESQRFARGAGFRLPIYPMKGYSITARPAAGAAALNHSVTDFDRKMAYAPLQQGGADVVRATGGADLIGLDRGLDAKRLALFTRHASEMLALDLDSDVSPWAGLRPSTPDGRPIIGPSPLRGLFLNTGHGSLGWTLACGAARLAAELIDGVVPSVEPGWFALERRH